MGVSVIVPARSELVPYLPQAIGEALLALAPPQWGDIEEIRMRAGQPVRVVSHCGQSLLGRDATLTADPAAAVPFTLRDAALLLDRATQSSAYALQEQMAGGFLTLPGGHRLGIAGRAVVDRGRLAGIRDVTCFCLRFAREVRGSADGLLPAIVDGPGGRVRSTLLVSPPRCGKTTVLRDAVRQLSVGLPRLGLGAQQVGLVDERSEVAGCSNGMPTRDVGPCTDVMDACPKALGMFTMLRGMAPDVLATDEIGRAEDAAAIEEAARSGVAVLATAHAWGIEDLANRAATARLLTGGHFSRLALLDRSGGPGTLTRVLDASAIRAAFGAGPHTAARRRPGPRVAGPAARRAI